MNVNLFGITYTEQDNKEKWQLLGETINIVLSFAVGCKLTSEGPSNY